MPAAYTEELAAIVAKVVNGADLLAQVEASLGRALTTDEIRFVDAFYRSPLGLRLVQAELRASEQAREADISAVEPALRAELDSDRERRAIYLEMDKALLATNLAVSMAQNLVQALAMGAFELQPDRSEAHRRQLLDRLAAVRGALGEKLRDSIILTFARTYRDVPVADLKDYLKFLKTEPARAAYATVAAEMDTFLDGRFRIVGREIAAFARQKRT